VFISGGHGGLARAIVECFSAAGWETDAPSHAALDVGDRSAVRRWFDCHAAYDLAVCAAGITRDRPFLKQTEEEWDEVMNVNVTGAASCGAAHAHFCNEERKTDRERKSNRRQHEDRAAVRARHIREFPDGAKPHGRAC